MKRRSAFPLFAMVFTIILLPACSPRPEIVAPEIEPPADLIPAYVPDGFELVSGFQLAGSPAAGEGEFPPLRRLDFNLKSPAGNEILGLYYQSPEQTILITKSAFPGGSLAEWRTAFEDASPAPCVCDGCPARAMPDPLSRRMPAIREERTIGGTDVAVLELSGGWMTVFVREGWLLTVESGLLPGKGGIPLAENLKIVADLLE